MGLPLRRSALALALAPVACGGSGAPAGAKGPPTARAPDASDAASAALGRPATPAGRIEGEPIFTVVEPDVIRAIDAPRLVDADAAEAFLAPDEPVLGVVGRDGSARCYSTWQLEAHEIVNDVLEGEPIAATW